MNDQIIRFKILRLLKLVEILALAIESADYFIAL